MCGHIGLKRALCAYVGLIDEEKNSLKVVCYALIRVHFNAICGHGADYHGDLEVPYKKVVI